jgi:hypothetical protein
LEVQPAEHGANRDVGAAHRKLVGGGMRLVSAASSSASLTGGRDRGAPRRLILGQIHPMPTH